MDIVNKSVAHSNVPRWHARTALRWINQAHMEGLSHLELVDSVPASLYESCELGRYALKMGLEAHSWYIRRHQSRPAYIEIDIGAIGRDFPKPYWLTPVPTLIITSALAHEVAHHLAATRGYIFRRGDNLTHSEYEEAAANRYSFSVIERMEKQRRYKIGRWLMNDLADWQHIAGILAFKDGCYDSAADRFHKAWSLNPDLEEAASGFWQARKKLSSGPETTEGHT